MTKKLYKKPLIESINIDSNTVITASDEESVDMEQEPEIEDF